jgi:hypothetical protein
MAQPRRLFVEAGQRYGRGTVTDPDIAILIGGHKNRAARLICDCGAEFTATLRALLAGTRKSCGCIRKDIGQAAGAARHEALLARIASGRKTCGRCHRELDRAVFPPQPSAPDGLGCYCRPCRAADASERYHRGRGDRQCVTCGLWRPGVVFTSQWRGRPYRNCPECRELSAAAMRSVRRTLSAIPDDKAGRDAIAKAAVTWRRGGPVPELTCCGGTDQHDCACPLRAIRPELLLA